MATAARVRPCAARNALWCSRLVSLLGSWLLVVAVPAYVFTLTGSLAATGSTLAAEYLPLALVGPYAGVLIDRWDRRRAMIAADVVRAVAVALLLLVQGPGDVWLVHLALVLESLGTALFRPAVQAHTPVVVGTGTALRSANALNAVTDGTVRLVGAPLGAALLGWVGFDLLVWLDTATYLLSASAILLMTSLATPDPRKPTGVDLVLLDFREGLAFLRAERTARGLLLINTLFLGANACLSALLVPYGITALGGSAQAGLVMSALGVGLLLGASLIGVLVDRVPPAVLLGGMLAVTGLGYALLFSATSPRTALPAAVLIGASGSIALGTVQTTLQRVTPNDMLGRTQLGDVQLRSGRHADRRGQRTRRRASVLDDPDRLPRRNGHLPRRSSVRLLLPRRVDQSAAIPLPPCPR